MTFVFRCGCALALVAALSSCTATGSSDSKRIGPSTKAPSPTPTTASSAPARAPIAPLPDVGASSFSPLPGSQTVTGRSSIVTGTVDRAMLTAYAKMADLAVTQVSESWKRSWPRTISILAPKDIDEFRRMTGRSTDADQIAAITDGPVSIPGHRTGDTVLINPRAFAALSEEGRRFVITHEATHVAMRASAPGPPPLWLAEGFADNVGYRSSARQRSELAASLLATVRSGKGPTQLPTAGDFDPVQGPIASSYLAAWLAVNLIEQRYGSATLQKFVLACSSAGSPAESEAACDRAFTSVLRTTPNEFTDHWLGYLRTLAQR